MTKIPFSDEVLTQLQVLQRHPHHVIRRRALVLILKSQAVPHHKIAQITDTCENTVRHCLEVYQQGGIEQLQTMNFYQPKSRVTSHPFFCSLSHPKEVETKNRKKGETLQLRNSRTCFSSLTSESFM